MEWIDVKQELPPTDDYECIIAFFNNESGPFSSAARWRDGKWWEENSDENDYGHLTVTHWMPLPLPPKSK